MSACSNDVPIHPILQGHAYDAIARDALARDARSIAVARLRSRLDLVFEDGGDRAARTDPVYVFELREGWKTPPPARLSVDAHWISCELPLEPGAWFLMFLDGATPLFIVDADEAESDLAALGDIDWFYSAGGELVRPDLLDTEESAPVPGDED